MCSEYSEGTRVPNLVCSGDVWAGTQVPDLNLVDLVMHWPVHPGYKVIPSTQVLPIDTSINTVHTSRTRGLYVDNVFLFVFGLFPLFCCVDFTVFFLSCSIDAGHRGSVSRRDDVRTG